MLRYLWLAIGLGIALGCDVKDKGPKAAAPAVGAASPPPLLALSTAVQERAEPFQYRVALSWVPQSQWVLLTRRRVARENEVLTALPPGASHYEDDSVESGIGYAYGLVASNDQRSPGVILAESGATIPRDLVLEGQRAVREIRQVGRLFLRDRAVICGIDGKLSIEAQRIISEDATLLLGERSPAGEGEKGRDAGLILVRAQAASGRLTIRGEGQEGGRGKTGARGAAGATGAAGGPAEVTRKTPVPGALAGQYDAYLEKLEKELAIDAPQWRSLLQCQRPPGNGGEGGRGGPGQTGNDGGRGGASARLQVEITNALGLELIPILTAGEGGAGGEGGEGGSGGEGGPPGLRDRHQICPAAGAGAMGVSGPKGRAGEKGKAGPLLSHCLILGNARLGNCDPALYYSN